MSGVIVQAQDHWGVLVLTLTSNSAVNNCVYTAIGLKILKNWYFDNISCSMWGNIHHSKNGNIQCVRSLHSMCKKNWPDNIIAIVSSIQYEISCLEPWHAVYIIPTTINYHNNHFYQSIFSPIASEFSKTLFKVMYSGTLSK